MRKLFLAAVGGTVLLSIAALTPASAMPAGPGAVRSAIETVNPVEKTGCWPVGTSDLMLSRSGAREIRSGARPRRRW